MVAFSPSTRKKLYQALKGSFPDAKIDDNNIEALAICLQKSHDFGDGEIPAELKDIDMSPHESELKEKGEHLPLAEAYACGRTPEDTHRYYWVEAMHKRMTPSGFEPFNGELAMARVTLDEDTPRDYHTAFGVVAKGDHLIDTVFEANQKYERHLGYPIERLDLITPARDLMRFGAISAFLGYKKKTDAAPSCYILEAGTATGQPKVTYLGKKLGEPINAYTGYRPTPFACPDHAYYGTLTVKDGDEPDRLHITARKVDGGSSASPYMEVDIRWKLQTGGLSNIWPGFLIARAAGIVIGRQLTKRISTECGEGLSPS